MTTTAITPFVPSSIEEASSLAERLSRSALLPDALKGKPADVLVTLITGHELGLSPMQSVRGLHVVKGRAVMSADLAVALVKRSDACVSFRLVESSDKVAIYETERKGEGKTRLEYTIQQATQAGLAGGGNWRRHPAAMLRARCSLALARAVYPDLVLGVYDPDEAKEMGGSALTADPVEKPLERAVDATPPPASQSVVEAAVEPQSSVEALKVQVQAYLNGEAPKPTPKERIKVLCEAAGLEGKEIGALVSRVTGKKRGQDLDEADFAAVEAALVPPKNAGEDVPF